MRYSDLIELYFERSNSLQWYWTIYVIVIGGLLAFSSMRVRPAPVTAILVTILYAGFAWKNLGAIHDVTMQRHATLQAIRQYPSTAPDAAETRAVAQLLEPTLVAPPYGGIRNFHLACDLLTIAAMWAMEVRRIRGVAQASRL